MNDIAPCPPPTRTQPRRSPTDAVRMVVVRLVTSCTTGSAEQPYAMSGPGGWINWIKW